MSTLFLLALSGALIAAGLVLILREVHKRRQAGLVGSATTPAESDGSVPNLNGTVPDAAIAPASTLSMRLPDHVPGLEPSPKLANRLEAVSTDRDAAADGPVEPADGRGARPVASPEPPPPPQWSPLQPVISSAVHQVNEVLASAGVAIGAPAEPSWSADKSYGSGRDVLVAGRSIATLRLECTQTHRLRATVSANDQTLSAHIDTNAGAPIQEATIGRVSEVLSKCMKPALSYALRAKSGLDGPSPQALERVVMGALQAGSGALSLAGARLVPLAPSAWEARLRCHRLPVAVEVFGADIARMHIDRREHEIEVAVGLPNHALANLGRRERIPLAEATTHALAEAIASCAWPAIASYRETRGNHSARVHGR